MKKKEFLIINIGFFICNLGIVNFLVPSNLAAGGVVGMATIIHSLMKLPLSHIILLLNIPIFMWGYYTYGRGYAMRCLYAITVFPLYSDLTERFFFLESVADFSRANPLAGAVISGIVVGAGIGFPVAVGSNTGGTVILAQVASKYIGRPVGSCIILIDFVVVLFSVFIFGIGSALLALVSLIITGIVIDKVALLLQRYLYKNGDGSLLERSTPL